MQKRFGRFEDSFDTGGFLGESSSGRGGKGKRKTPLVVTPALFVVIILKVLLNVKEANVIVDTL